MSELQRYEFPWLSAMPNADGQWVRYTGVQDMENAYLNEVAALIAEITALRARVGELETAGSLVARAPRFNSTKGLHPDMQDALAALEHALDR